MEGDSIAASEYQGDSFVIGQDSCGGMSKEQDLNSLVLDALQNDRSVIQLPLTARRYKLIASIFLVLAATTAFVAVSYSATRKFKLETQQMYQMGAKQYAKITSNSNVNDIIDQQKRRLRHNGQRAVHRQLSLAELSDPKSVEFKGTPEIINKRGGPKYSKGGEIDYEFATIASENAAQNQQPLAQQTIEGREGGAASTTNALSNNANAPMENQQQWQPSQETQQQQPSVQPTTGGLAYGSSSESTNDQQPLAQQTIEALGGGAAFATNDLSNNAYTPMENQQQWQQPQETQRQQPSVQPTMGGLSYEPSSESTKDDVANSEMQKILPAQERQQLQPSFQPTTGGLLDGATVESTAYVSSNSANDLNMSTQQWQPAQQMQQELPSFHPTAGGFTGKTSTESTKEPGQDTQHQQLSLQPTTGGLGGGAVSTTNDLSNNAYAPMETQQQWQPPQATQQQQQSVQATMGGLSDEASIESTKVASSNLSYSPSTTDNDLNFETQQREPAQQMPQGTPLGQTTTGLEDSTTNMLPTAQQPEQNPSQKKSTLPQSFENLANFPSVFQPGDTPVLWNIPKGGTSIINDILAGCLQLATANNVGNQFGHAQDETLQVFQKHGAVFVNVNTFTIEGIAKAKKLKLVSSGMADVIVVNHVHEASELFSPGHRGKIFTLLRDPIERALLIIKDKKDDVDAATYDPKFSTMTIEDFAKSGILSTNWLTRWLSNQQTGALREEHLDLAKEILRAKFVVGIFSRLDKSVENFEKYFGWKVSNNEHREKCVSDHMAEAKSEMNSLSAEIPKKGSKEYDALLELNHYDVELYRYAQVLFQEQLGYFEAFTRPEFGT